MKRSGIDENDSDVRDAIASDSVRYGEESPFPQTADITHTQSARVFGIDHQ